MMDKLIRAFGITLVLALAVAPAWAVQEQAQEQEQESITGCLNKADEADTFVLAKENTGEEVTVTGPEELANHASNHKVKLTGEMKEEGGKQVFHVTQVEHIAATCEATTN